MSGQATGWVLRHGPHPAHVDRFGRAYGTRARGLRAVLHTVADSANPDGKHSHPGIEAVQRGALYSRRQAIDLLGELEAEGWLSITEQGGGRGQATVYDLVMVEHQKGAATSTPTPQTDPQNSAVTPDKGCSLEPERVQSGAETVQSGLHPNVVTTTTNVKAQPPLPPNDAVALASDGGGSDTDRIFAAWVEAKGSRAVLDPKRRRLIAARLKEFPVDDLIDAVRGWRRSAHHCGDNDRHTVYNDLSLLLRDADHVERFRDLERGEGTVSTPVNLPRRPARLSNVEAGLANIAQATQRAQERNGHDRAIDAVGRDATLLADPPAGAGRGRAVVRHPGPTRLRFDPPSGGRAENGAGLDADAP